MCASFLSINNLCKAGEPTTELEAKIMLKLTCGENSNLLISDLYIKIMIKDTIRLTAFQLTNLDTVNMVILFPKVFLKNV